MPATSMSSDSAVLENVWVGLRWRCDTRPNTRPELHDAPNPVPPRIGRSDSPLSHARAPCKGHGMTRTRCFKARRVVAWSAVFAAATAACGDGMEQTSATTSLTATTMSVSGPAASIGSPEGGGITLERGVLLYLSPSPTLVRDDSTTGLAGESVTSHLLRAADGTFVVAVHRGTSLADSLTSARYRRSARTSRLGRSYYEAETPFGRELAWAQSPDLLVFVTSTDLDFDRLATIADAITATG